MKVSLRPRHSPTSLFAAAVAVAAVALGVVLWWAFVAPGPPATTGAAAKAGGAGSAPVRTADATARGGDRGAAVARAAGERTPAPLVGADAPPPGEGRLVLRVRFVDGGPVDGVVPVWVEQEGSRQRVQIAPGEEATLDLPPGPLEAWVVNDRGLVGNASWVPGGQSRGSAHIVEGEAALLVLTLTRAGEVVVEATGDAHPRFLGLKLVGPRHQSLRAPAIEGPIGSQTVAWSRLRPGEYELRGGALAHPVSVTVAAGETKRLTVHPEVARIVTRVRVMASDGSDPYEVPARVMMARLVTVVNEEGALESVASTTRTSIARPGEPVEDHVLLGRYRVSAEPLDGRSFRALLDGRSSETEVDLSASGADAEVEIRLELDAPAGVAVLRFEAEGSGDAWLHAVDRSVPPLRVARRGLGGAFALDIASYGSGAVEVTDAEEPGAGEALRVDLLTPGSHTWRLRMED